MATATAATTGPLAGRSSWLFGPVVDLLCGYGVGYVLTIPVLLGLGAATGLHDWPMALALPLALLLSVPHYGATLLRVFEQRRDRQRYAFFAVHFTVAVVAVFVYGLWNPLVGSLALTLYVSWSPWHFAGQNYGLGLMWLRRRGVEITPRFKRLFYASFVLSFALAFVSIHVEAGDALYAQGASDESGTYGVFRLGIPRPLAGAIAPLLGIAYAATLAGAAWALRGRAGLRDVGPVVPLVATQGLWFAIPGLMQSYGLGASSLPFAAVWISAAHSLQYLWVTAYYARRAEEPTRTRPFLAKAMLAGCAVSIFPLLLFVPGLLGAWLPPTAGVGVLVFAMVNLHHFVLDGAIWKLRDGRVARALLRTEVETAPLAPAAAPRERHPLRRLVWAAGALSLAFPLYVLTEVALGSSANLARVEGAAARLAFFGRDTSVVLANLAWLQERNGRAADAIETYRRMVEVDETNPAADGRAAALLVRTRASDPASLEEAIERAKRASTQLGHRDPTVLHTLSLAFAASGDPQNARRTGERAVALASAQGNAALAARIRRDLTRIDRPAVGARAGRDQGT